MFDEGCEKGRAEEHPQRASHAVEWDRSREVEVKEGFEWSSGIGFGGEDQLDLLGKVVVFDGSF